MLRKAEAFAAAEPDYSVITDDEAQDVLMLIFSHFPRWFAKAMEQSEPSMITRHTTQLAQAYNKYYFEHRIMDESDPAGTAARVNLTRAVRDVIKTGCIRSVWKRRRGCKGNAYGHRTASRAFARSGLHDGAAPYARNRAMAALVDLMPRLREGQRRRGGADGGLLPRLRRMAGRGGARGGGFAREALEAVLFEESPAALLCARMDVLPLQPGPQRAGQRSDALGRLTAIEPAIPAANERGMSGQTAARLPVWEPTLAAKWATRGYPK